MYRRGHVGLALLAYAPMAFALSSRGAVGALALGLGCAVCFGVVPDLDRRLPLVSHRGITHTVLGGLLGCLGAAAAVGVLLATTDPPATGSAGPPIPAAAALVFVASFLGFSSHLFGDVLTPMGIAPFWPGSGRRYTFDVVAADSPRANAALSWIGRSVLAGAVVAGTAVRTGSPSPIGP